MEKETVQVSTLRIGAGAADGPQQPASGLASARVPSLSPLTPPSPLWSSLQRGFEDQLGRRAWQWRDSGVGRGVRMPGQGGCRPYPQSSFGFYLYFLGRAHVRRTRMRPYGYYQWGQGRVSFREMRASSPPPVRLPLTPRSRYTNFISIYTCTLPMAHVSHHLHASWILLSIAESIF